MVRKMYCVFWQFLSLGITLGPSYNSKCVCVYVYLNSISRGIQFPWKYLDAVVKLTDANRSRGWFSFQSVQHLYMRFILNSYGVYIAGFVSHCLKKKQIMFLLCIKHFLRLLYV